MLTQTLCLEIEIAGACFLAEPSRTARCIKLGGIDVALNFGERDRSLG